MDVGDGCESWTIKKSERQRTDAFQLWCWRRLLKVPWTAKRSNQSMLREIHWIFTLNIHWTDWCWSWSSCILVIWYEQMLIGKVPDAGKDWEQKEKRASEDEMAGRHHWCNLHKLEQTLGDGERQGDLACCSSWGLKELDMIRRLNNNYSTPNSSYFVF